MADLEYKPLAFALPDGRIAVYVGAAYSYLPHDKAVTLRDLITAALEGVAQNAQGQEVVQLPASWRREGMVVVVKAATGQLLGCVGESIWAAQADTHVERAKVPAITPAMVHEMEAHLPYVVSARGNLARWEWQAEYLNRSLREPDKPCACCGVTPQGEMLASDAEVRRG